MTRVILHVTCTVCLLASPVTTDTVFQRLIDRAVYAGVPGLQAYVRRGDQRWFGRSGVASVETQRPMALSDRIRLASITKMITYATVHELARKGRFVLSDRAITLLPAGTLDGIPNARDVTVRQLLEHTSGVHNFNGNDGADFFHDLFSDPERGARVWSSSDLISYAKKPNHAPTGRPGEQRSYSSTGYIILEMILEHSERKAINQLYREYVFAPLGMLSAGVEGGDLTATVIVDSYARPENVGAIGALPFKGRKPCRADGLVNLSKGLRYYNAWARGAGAVAANVQDLARFMDAVTAGRRTVLSDQDAEFARSRQRKDSFLAWNGGSWGIQASILYEPERELTVIVLSNGSNAGPASQDIAKELLIAARNDN